MSCDVGKATEVLENELWCRWSNRKLGEWALLILAHSPTFPLLHLRHSSFFNPSVALPTPQLILQPFRCFTYATAHSPTLTSLYLRHNSFSNPSIASPTSQLILQPLRHFTYATTHSPTLLLLLLSHDIFTYVTWRAGHADCSIGACKIKLAQWTLQYISDKWHSVFLYWCTIIPLF